MISGDQKNASTSILLCANQTSEGNQWCSAEQQLRLHSHYIYVLDIESDNLQNNDFYYT